MGLTNVQITAKINYRKNRVVELIRQYGLYPDGCLTTKTISERLGICRSLVTQYIREYNDQSEDKIIMRGIYTSQQKEDYVKAVLKFKKEYPDEPFVKICRKLGMYSATLKRWIKDYRRDNGDSWKAFTKKTEKSFT